VGFIIPSFVSGGGYQERATCGNSSMLPFGGNPLRSFLGEVFTNFDSHEGTRFVWPYTKQTKDWFPIVAKEQ